MAEWMVAKPKCGDNCDWNESKALSNTATIMTRISPVPTTLTYNS